MNRLAEQIRRRRDVEGISQRRLADLCGLSRPTIARIEAGVDVSVSSMEKVGAALGLKLEFKSAQ